MAINIIMIIIMIIITIAIIIIISSSIIIITMFIIRMSLLLVSLLVLRPPAGPELRDRPGAQVRPLAGLGLLGCPPLKTSRTTKRRN